MSATCIGQPSSCGGDGLYPIELETGLVFACENHKDRFERMGEHGYESGGAMSKFYVGQGVVKLKGYPFDSTVVAVFQNLAGETRLVCESAVIPGMLHIFSPNQMEDAG